ncbi:MAG: hypothetical protein JO317_09410 [Verrucomicrobiae bacterium]|nr:hypothetical protein [Verrucomicrobiae bacterium]
MTRAERAVQERAKAKAIPAREAAGGPFAILPAAALAVALLAAYALVNWVFFRVYGWPATNGADLWFYLAVAKGLQKLAWIDPTFWIVKPFGGLGPEQGFMALGMLAIGLHVFSALLVYFYLGRIAPFSKTDRTGRWLAAWLFGLLPQNIALATASFTHFSVAQPLIIVAAGELIPWMLEKKSGRPPLGGLAALILAMVIGPEGWMLAGGLAVWTAARRFHWSKTFESRSIHPGWVAAGAAAISWILFPSIVDLWTHVVGGARGIDLAWQREIRSGDLLPMGWRTFTIFAAFHLAWVALIGWAAYRKQWLSAVLPAIFLAFTFRMVRAFYALELAGFLALTLVLARRDFPAMARHIVLGTLAAWLLFLGLFGRQNCAFGVSLVHLAQKIAKSKAQPGSIACAPTYGFFFQVWTGRPTTDDLHHPTGPWAQLVTQTPLQANRRMLDQKIRYLILTDYDYKPGPGGYWSSGGLDAQVKSLSDEDLRQSLLARTLQLTPPPILPVRIVAMEVDPVSQQRAFCLAPEARFEMPLALK